MPVTFKCFRDRGLVAVKMSGVVTWDELEAATQAYITSPGYRPGQKQLVDMREVTGHDSDHVRFMLMQARKVGRLAHTGTQSITVYVAPHKAGHDLARMFVRSWQYVDAVVPIIQDCEAKGLALLGQPETTIAALMQTAPDTASR